MVMPGVGLTRGQQVGGDARGGASPGAGLTQSRLGAGGWRGTVGGGAQGGVCVESHPGPDPGLEMGQRLQNGNSAQATGADYKHLQ